MLNDLYIAGQRFNSRLITGTGKHSSFKVLAAAAASSGCEMITVAIRRINMENPNEPTVLTSLDWSRYRILPNTAGSKTAEEAVFTAKMARESTGSDWIKVEVIPDSRYLLPDPLGTLHASDQLVREGFTVLPYISADPVLAKRLEEVGCATVMPLASPIGSGRGFFTAEEIGIIIEQANIPVVVDAGLGVPSDASKAMEMGADAVLVNTAIAEARNPVMMAEAFKLGVEAGRKAFLAGRMKMRSTSSASSPSVDILS